MTIYLYFQGYNIDVNFIRFMCVTLCRAVTPILTHDFAIKAFYTSNSRSLNPPPIFSTRKQKTMNKWALSNLAFSLAALAFNAAANDSAPWVGNYSDPSVIGYVVQLNEDGTVTVTGSGTELYSGTYALKDQHITLTYDSSFRQKQPETATEMGSFDTQFKTLTITRALNGATVSRKLIRSSAGQ